MDWSSAQSSAGRPTFKTVLVPFRLGFCENVTESVQEGMQIAYFLSE